MDSKGPWDTGYNPINCWGGGKGMAKPSKPLSQSASFDILNSAEVQITGGGGGAKEDLKNGKKQGGALFPR